MPDLAHLFLNLYTVRAVVQALAFECLLFHWSVRYFVHDVVRDYWLPN